MSKTRKINNGLVGVLDSYLGKGAPVQLPQEARKFIARFGPLVVGAIAVFLTYNLVTGAAISAIFSPEIGPRISFSLMLSVLSLLLLDFSVPGLFQGKIQGWMLLLYSVLLSFIAGLIIMGNPLNLLTDFSTTLIQVIFVLYLIFQAKSQYK